MSALGLHQHHPRCLQLRGFCCGSHPPQFPRLSLPLLVDPPAGRGLRFFPPSLYIVICNIQQTNWAYFYDKVVVLKDSHSS